MSERRSAVPQQGLERQPLTPGPPLDPPPERRRGTPVLVPVLAAALLIGAVAAIAWVFLFRDSGGEAPSVAAPRGKLFVSVHRLEFGDVGVGTRSAAQAVVLTNRTTVQVAIGHPSLEGAGRKDFVLAPPGSCAGATLALGASCTIRVDFEPTVVGRRAASLAVPVTGPGGDHFVELRGGGTGQAIPIVAATMLDFGGRGLAAPADVRELTVTNAGTLPLPVRRLAIVGEAKADYRVRKGGCTTVGSLAGGADCTVSVAFDPAKPGVRRAELVVYEQGSARTAIDLRGVGLRKPAVPKARLSPATRDFGTLQVGSAGRPGAVTLESSGPAPLTIAWIAVVGGASADFAILPGGSCAVGAELASGSSCTVDVRFAPTETGPRRASLVVATNARTFAEAELQGSGRPQPQPETQPGPGPQPQEGPQTQPGRGP